MRFTGSWGSSPVELPEPLGGRSEFPGLVKVTKVTGWGLPKKVPLKKLAHGIHLGLGLVCEPLIVDSSPVGGMAAPLCEHGVKGSRDINSLPHGTSNPMLIIA